ncbi:MAG: hypothetical protein CM1200mP41_34470 [Gammaproteobacteria bacterium]|nr:MAG: hypothetical protein CM1200mP41_34470 [Gammaproteobacteria bacterium]
MLIQFVSYFLESIAELRGEPRSDSDRDETGRRSITMELFFLAVLFILMVGALGSGFPVAFSLPGSAIFYHWTGSAVWLVLCG